MTLTRTIFLNQLEFQALIGVYDFEKTAPSRLRLTLELTVDFIKVVMAMRLIRLFPSEDVLKGVETLAMDHHRELLETLAEDIADFCFADPRVGRVDMKLEKPDMFTQTESVGVRLNKARN